jgi:hypothetical protein
MCVKGLTPYFSLVMLFMFNVIVFGVQAKEKKGTLFWPALP